MKRLLAITLTSALLSCGQVAEQSESDETKAYSIPALAESTVLIIDSTGNAEKEVIQAIQDYKQIELTEPVVIIVEMDSLEMERLKKLDGEDNFYTAADDLMWYNSQLHKKMDLLGRPMVYTEQDTIKVLTPTKNYEITKDTTFSLYTYFYYDGNELSRVGIFDLLDK